MTSLVTSYAAAVNLPKRAKRNHLYCIYCGIIVGESIELKDSTEYEPYVNTDEGPVCEACFADPRVKERIQMAAVHSKRKKIHNAQCRRPLSPEEQAMRDERIAELRAAGKCYAEIGEIVGLSISDVDNALRRVRRKRDKEIMRLAGLGWSWKRISDEVGISPSMVGKVVKRNRS